jgi:hypothetical protein
MLLGDNRCGRIVILPSIMFHSVGVCVSNMHSISDIE